MGKKSRGGPKIRSKLSNGEKSKGGSKITSKLSQKCTQNDLISKKLKML